jgi:hypothetical protein
MFSFLLIRYLEVQFLDHMTTLLQLFDELLICFPKWLQLFTIPPAVYESLSFLFEYGLASAYEAGSYFELHFSDG